MSIFANYVPPRILREEDILIFKFAKLIYDGSRYSTASTGYMDPGDSVCVHCQAGSHMGHYDRCVVPEVDAFLDKYDEHYEELFHGETT